jgi:hypothetical protein
MAYSLRRIKAQMSMLCLCKAFLSPSYGINGASRHRRGEGFQQGWVCPLKVLKAQGFWQIQGRRNGFLAAFFYFPKWGLKPEDNPCP